jgi:hypothetical protein
MKERIMENGNQNLVDLSVKAKEAGIELPVIIDGLLLRELTPTPFLASLGLSLEERIKNLLSLVKASLSANDVFDGRDGRNACLPFTVVAGPFVREECLSIIAKISREEGGAAAITLAKGNDG